MSNILATYDIFEVDNEVRDVFKSIILNQKGYLFFLNNSTGIISLPSTTVIKSGISSKVAKAELVAVAKSLGIKNMRLIVVEFISFDGMECGRLVGIDVAKE